MSDMLDYQFVPGRDDMADRGATDFRGELRECDRQVNTLLVENAKLRRAARLIHDRYGMVSGSLEMAECDAACKEVGLEPWKWPIPVPNKPQGD